MHSTIHLDEIIESGFIDDSFSEEGNKGNYFLYVWNGIPIHPRMEWNYSSNRCVLVFDTSICKLNKTYACDSVQYGSCIDHKESRIFYSNHKIPDFTALKQHIVNKINKEISMKQNHNAYIHSHEIVILGKIPIEYIKAVLVPKKVLTHIDKYPKSKYNIKFMKTLQMIKDKNIKIIPVAKIPNNFHKYFLSI